MHVTRSDYTQKSIMIIQKGERKKYKKKSHIWSEGEQLPTYSQSNQLDYIYYRNIPMMDHCIKLTAGAGQKKEEIAEEEREKRAKNKNKENKNRSSIFPWQDNYDFLATVPVKYMCKRIRKKYI